MFKNYICYKEKNEYVPNLALMHLRSTTAGKFAIGRTTESLEGYVGRGYGKKRSNVKVERAVMRAQAGATSPHV